MMLDQRVQTDVGAFLDGKALHTLHRDLETKSEAVLKTAGVHRYATDRSTEVLCCAFAVDDEPVKLWTPGDTIPPEVIEAAINPSWLVCAHGAHFEAAIEHHVLRPRFGWPAFPPEKQRCTQAMCLAAGLPAQLSAAAMGLPAQLSAAAIALELSNRKDAAGERLMHQLSKPRRPRKDENPNEIYWFADADRLKRLYEYCRQDVEIERELYNRLPRLSNSEQLVWILSSRINQRGFLVDRAFAQAARKIAETAAPEIDQELTEITEGMVTSIAQVAKLLKWLQDNGCSLEKLDKRAVEQQIEADNLHLQVRRVLELRLSGAQAAVKKSTPYLRVPTMMGACEDLFDITAQLRAGGLVKGRNRKI